jgi:FkbM family methyltransferase
MPMNHEDYDFTQNGEYEMVTAAMGVPREGDRPFVFFDVGANRGNWTSMPIIQGQPVEGHLFDVSPNMIEILTERYGEDERLTINHIALSNEAGTTTFKHYYADEGLNTLISDTPYWDGQREGTVETCKTMRGDDYCEQHGIEQIDLLKIDCEGWDWFVLQGFDRMLSEHRITVVQWEYGFTNGDIRILSKDFWEFFEARGYICGPLRKAGVAFQSFVYIFNNFDSGPNFVAVLPHIVGGKTA